jgi:hypothetical protein
MVSINCQFQHRRFSNDEFSLPFPSRAPGRENIFPAVSLPADAAREAQAFDRKRLYAVERAIFSLGDEFFPVFSRAAGKNSGGCGGLLGE